MNHMTKILILLVAILVICAIGWFVLTKCKVASQSDTNPDTISNEEADVESERQVSGGKLSAFWTFAFVRNGLPQYNIWPLTNKVEWQTVDMNLKYLSRNKTYKCMMLNLYGFINLHTHFGAVKFGVLTYNANLMSYPTLELASHKDNLNKCFGRLSIMPKCYYAYFEPIPKPEEKPTAKDKYDDNDEKGAAPGRVEEDPGEEMAWAGFDLSWAEFGGHSIVRQVAQAYFGEVYPISDEHLNSALSGREVHCSVAGEFMIVQSDNVTVDAMTKCLEDCWSNITTLIYNLKDIRPIQSYTGNCTGKSTVSCSGVNLTLADDIPVVPDGVTVQPILVHDASETESMNYYETRHAVNDVVITAKQRLANEKAVYEANCQSRKPTLPYPSVSMTISPFSMDLIGRDPVILSKGKDAGVPFMIDDSLEDGPEESSSSSRQPPETSDIDNFVATEDTDVDIVPEVPPGVLEQSNLWNKEFPGPED